MPNLCASRFLSCLHAKRHLHSWLVDAKDKVLKLESINTARRLSYGSAFIIESPRTKRTRSVLPHPLPFSLTEVVTRLIVAAGDAYCLQDPSAVEGVGYNSDGGVSEAPRSLKHS